MYISLRAQYHTSFFQSLYISIMLITFHPCFHLLPLPFTYPFFYHFTLSLDLPINPSNFPHVLESFYLSNQSIKPSHLSISLPISPSISLSCQSIRNNSPPTTWANKHLKSYQHYITRLASTRFNGNLVVRLVIA